MRNFAVCGAGVPALNAHNTSIRTARIHGLTVWCGVLPTVAEDFDPEAPENARRVQIRVRAFSCNYRDKAAVLKVALNAPPDAYYVLGSEFAAEVVAAGRAVTRVKVGDRVIGDNCWPEKRPKEWRAGVPTNHGSRELLVFREEKVARVPASMPDPVAAAFSIGAQTAYSMAERVGAAAGSRVLVTAGRSNTSLFAIGALASRGAQVYATTTDTTADDRLKALGVQRVFHVDAADARSWLDHDELKSAAKAMDGFDAVIDPFFDLHLVKVLPLVRYGGRYITCGFYDQYAPVTGGGAGTDYRAALEIAMVKNIQIIGNCCGLTRHLEHALADYEAGRLPVLVDSVHSGEETAAFLERTFAARDRLGKVVFSYV